MRPRVRRNLEDETGLGLVGAPVDPSGNPALFLLSREKATSGERLDWQDAALLDGCPPPASALPR
jgi:hypothetical protein